MKSITVRITEGPLLNVDLVELGSRTGQLWMGETLSFAGVGHAGSITVKRPNGGAAAAAQLASMAGPNDLSGRPGTGPLAIGAFPFDRTKDGALQVPAVALADDGDERWLTHFESNETAAETAVLNVMAQHSPEEDVELSLRPTRPATEWRDAVVRVARDRIVDGDLRKVVLAREVLVTAPERIGQARIVRSLARRFPTATCFAVDGFVGASPERLVSRSGRVVRACPLAGTAARSDDPEEDSAQIDGLRGSTKDQVEHRITIEWLLSELLPFCSYVDAEPEPSIMTMANVHHLATVVEGMLSEPAASVLDLVGAVHPTPALGGDPQSDALALIESIEGMDRGRYGGPVGWVDATGNGDFAVGIRSAQIDGRTARVWAGVGVVAQSDPEAELVETQAKFRALLGSLLG